MNNSLFSTAMRLIDPVIEKVSDTNMQQPTPCSEWDVKALTNHMLNELAWIAPLVEGKTIAEVGDMYDGDLIKVDAAASWMQFCKEASAAIKAADPKATAHLSYADKPNQAYVDEVAADLIVHGWDLAKALGESYEIDDTTATAVHAATKDVLDSAREYGLIAPAVMVGNDASAADKLLASYGRNPDWQSQ